MHRCLLMSPLFQMSAIDFLRMAQRFRVGEMLRLGPIKTRVADRDGISYTEFSYQILQAYDWLQLVQRYSCSVQVQQSHDKCLGDVVSLQN